MYLDNRIAHTEAKQKPMCGTVVSPFAVMGVGTAHKPTAARGLPLCG